MPDRYWSGPLAFAVFGVLISIVFGWLLWDFSALHAEQRVRESEFGSLFLTSREDLIDEKCRNLEFTLLQKCVQLQIESTREFLVSEWDLDAQQQMALFTRIMGYTAVFGTVIGVGSVLLIYATLASTQQMTRDARKVGDAQSRAWLSVNCSLSTQNIQKSQDGRTGIYITTSAHMKNHGRSPATKVSFIAELVFKNPGSGTPEEMLRRNFEKTVSGNEYFSDTVFPEGESPSSHSVVLWLDEVDARLKGQQFKAIHPYLLTCTTYTCAYSQKTHQTLAAYAMIYHTNGQTMALGPYHGNWPIEPIHLAHPGLVLTT